MIDEQLLNKIESKEDNHPAIARLVELGRQKSFVTIDDILTLFPDAEQDVDQLEEAFAALLSAGIPFVDEATQVQPSDDEISSVDEDESEEDSARAAALAPRPRAGAPRRARPG